ncbi:AAA family ATPase [Corallococcus exiguus]|uniref:AAA family ATPase n=1 Tax=Corallococcus exiguus TaxID=83462 RepID=UPI003DA5C70D
MYIRHLKVENLKRLRSFELDFLHDGEPRMWTVLIGENGTAKTTLLQAIALAAAGYRDVSGLAGASIKNLPDRRVDETMSIDTTFVFGDASRKATATVHPRLGAPRGRVPKEIVLTSRVSLPPGMTSMDAVSFYGAEGLGFRQRDPLAEARATNRPLWFVSGYGIARVLPGANETPALARPSIERLEPLFGQKQLASIGFANHFLLKDQQEGRTPGTTSRLFSKLLNQAVKTGGADLFPGLARLELRGHGGARSGAALIESDRFYQQMAVDDAPVAIAGVALSHGYQSTFAWIADLIGHVLLESQGVTKTSEMEGLVLIDEIDLYLHPTWQANFIPALRRVFPRMQFVATTHSPVVLSSLAPHEIVRLVVDEQTGDVVRGGWSRDAGRFQPGIEDAEHQPDPRTMTGGELYRTWFGLEGMTPNPLGEKLRKLQVLSTHPAPTPIQRKELREVRNAVQKDLKERLGVSEGKKAFEDFQKSSKGDQ